MPFTIFVTETNGDTTTEVFRSTRENIDLPAIFAAAMKQGRRKRSDAGKSKTQQPDLLNQNPSTGETP